jgi:S1-C subfamily serine protease
MRTVKGNRPPSMASRSGLGGLNEPAASLIPQPPPRLYRAGPGDILTHIDGVAVTSYERFVYAVNAAANKRDIPVVVTDGHTGRRHLYFITAFKVTP